MAPISESGEFYHGSRLLSPLTSISGLSIDQVNFLVCQLAALALGFPFRHMLDPRTTSPKMRHAAELLVGVALVLFCFGSQTIHLFVHATLGYVLLQFIGRRWMPTAVFVVGMGYLAYCHIYRMVLDYGGYTLDITGPLMISTQKITIVAFGLDDGTQRNEKDLNSNQKQKSIRKMPDILTFYSYIFSFHNVMCGPPVFFNDYVAFIDGTCFGDARSGKEDKAIPSPVESVVKKMLFALVLGVLMMIEPYIAPWQKLKEKEFLYHSSWSYKMLYLLCSMTMHRPMYYFAWKLGELVNNSCGLGFSGYDANGKAKWDLLNNVNIYALEMSTSLKVNIDSWNVLTSQWLRYAVYERCRPSIAIWVVFLISAFWHGFYPGYYIAFLTAALFTTAARLIRGNMRSFFIQSPQLRFFYDCVTFVFTRFANCIMVSSFALLEVKDSLALFTSVNWWLHILSFGTIIYFNYIHTMIRPRKKEKIEKTN